MVHTFHIEIDLKPTDESYGNDLEEEQASLQAALQRDVPWTYSRTHVPVEFARNRIRLESWRRAVDSASQLWKDRTAALAAQAQARARTCSVFGTFLFMIPFIAFTILLSYTDDRGDLPQWSGFVVIGAILLVIIFTMILVSVNRSFIHQYMNILAEFEQKWSSLAKDLNTEYGQRGVTVETVRTAVLKRERRLAWTVGLGFQFRMQPVDDEEVAWCNANSQSGDVEDDMYQSRKLRVIRESPLSQDEEMTNGVDVLLGEQSGMAVAIAVVDDADVENSGDVGTFNEKAALLNLV
jgi:hypothetical protein